MKKMLGVLLALLIAATAWATSLRCPIDNGSLWFTGKTRVDIVVLFEHQCGMGHRFWLTSQQMSE